jgi:hypothetical protein
MNTKIDKKLHISLLNIIETVDKNEEQLKELIKKSIFEDANIPDDEKDNAVKMYTMQFLEMRSKLSNTETTPEPHSSITII